MSKRNSSKMVLILLLVRHLATSAHRLYETGATADPEIINKQDPNANNVAMLNFFSTWLFLLLIILQGGRANTSRNESKDYQII
jgi:hypothetical protein